MARLRVNAADLHYEESGAGPESIVFAHGLLFSGRMFADQVEALRDRYRCIAFDFRGQGESEVTAAGYDMDTLARDAAALIEALECAPCHFAGLSMGGFVGLRLAIRRPELLRSLILLDTSADPEPETSRQQYGMLNFIARWFGLGLVVNRVMRILFGRTFLADPSRDALKRQWRARVVANDRIGITRAVRGVIDRAGVQDELDRVRVPTLIIVGEEDVATPRSKAERIHAGIAGSRLVVIPRAGHSSTVEEPEAVSAALKSFLEDSGKRP